MRSTRMVVLACAGAALSSWLGGTRIGMPNRRGVFKPVDMGELETRSGLHFGFTNCFTNFMARAVRIVEQGEKRNLDGKLVGDRAQILLPVANIPLPAPFPPSCGRTARHRTKSFPALRATSSNRRALIGRALMDTSSMSSARFSLLCKKCSSR
jgi:hypothetical protein